MLKNLKDTLKNSLVYSLGNISTKLAGFILIPLYTSYLSIADFGSLAILEISTQFFITVISLKLAYALMRFYWDEEFLNKQNSIFFTTFIFLSATSAIILFILNLFSEHISVLLFDSASFTELIYLVLLNTGLQTIFNLLLTKLRIEEKSLYFSVVNVLRLVVTLVLTIYFIVYLGRGVEGIYEAHIIGISVSLLSLVKYTLNQFEFKFEWRAIKVMLNFSFPLIFAEISGSVFIVTSRYALNFLTSLENVGIFSLGYKIANTINVFILASAMLAITPMIYKKMNDPSSKRFYSKIMTYLGFGLMICILWVSLFSWEIVKFLAKNKEYWDASYVIPILAFTILFTMLRDISQTGLHITKKTKIVALSISFMAVINLLLNILLIPIWRSIGAALATLIAQIIFFLIIYSFAQKWYPIPYEIKKILKLIIVGGVLYGMGQLTNDFNLLPRLLIKHLLILLYPIILYYWNFYDQIELDRINGFWQEWKRFERWRTALVHLKKRN